MFVLLLEGVTQILWLDLALGSIFLIEYLVRIWVAKSRLEYIFSRYGIVDLLSCIPVFFEISTSNNLQVLRAVQVFRVLRILRFARFLDDGEFFFGTISKFHLQELRVVFTVLASIFCASGFFAAVEGPTSKYETVESFGEALYFIIITFSTVGYGDITPQSDLGRYSICVFIIINMIFVPLQVSELLQISSENKASSQGLVRNAECKQCGLLRHDRDATHCKQCGNVIFQHTIGVTKAGHTTLASAAKNSMKSRRGLPSGCSPARTSAGGRSSTPGAGLEEKGL
mmetsp:Transcript_23468/g.35151  ORF Transcript_23468/g.35151 Transcript_23468/m.35151 type:complete len:285 (+) Transcript_23468:221-1075(+)